MRNFLGRHLGLPVWALALIVVVSIGLGGAGGSSSAKEDPEAQKSLVSAQASAREANDRATKAEADAANAETVARSKLEGEFAQRKAEQDQVDARLKERETAVSAAEVAKKANVIEGDGVYQVGVDIQPGTWKTSGSGQSCYWQTTSKGGDILDNDNVSGPTIVVIPASAFSFKTARCGTWTKTG